MTDSPATAITLRESRKQALEKALGGRVGGLHLSLSHFTDRYFEDRIRELRKISPSTPWAVIAVGGYGRGTLCPESDIDVLLLFERRIPDDAKNFANNIFHPLWDLGLDLGNGVRTIKDCVSLANKDHKVLASLIDARLLAGDTPVFNELRDRMQRKVFSKKLKWFAKILQSNNLERAEIFGDSAGRLEPDLKRGLGGLRDAQQVFWLSSITSETPFTPMELSSLRDDEAFLLRVRTALHLAAGRKTERLSFDLHRETASIMGFVNSGDSPDRAGAAVEFFLSRLHKAMGRIRSMREAMFQHVLPDKAWCKLGRVHLSPVFEGCDDGLRFSSTQNILPQDVLMLFRTIAATGVPPAWSARRIVTERAAYWAEGLRNNTQTIDGLLDIFKAPFGRSATLFMAATTFLSELIPEFGKVRHLVQFDDYHVHPVGRHTMETIATLADIFRNEDHPYHYLVEMAGNDKALLLAALYHDLGKLERDHAVAGADIVRKALADHGRPEQEIDDVAFLVEQHLLLPVTATRRDLGDEAVVARAAGIAGTRGRLAQLFLLSIADSQATGPKAWNSWTESLMNELFAKAERFLAPGGTWEPDETVRMMIKREEVRQLAMESMAENDLDRILDQIPPRAFLTLEPKTVLRHISMTMELKNAVSEDRVRKSAAKAGRGVNVIHAEEGCVPGTWKLHLALLDRPGLFATIAGVLVLHNLGIHACDVFTWGDGTALDVFTVRVSDGIEDIEDVWQRVSRSLEYSLTGKLDLPYRLEQRRSSIMAMTKRSPDLPAMVNVDNDVSDFDTVVEVGAQDRIGLLHDLAAALARLGMQITQARIATMHGRAADIFHILDADGLKVTDADAMESLKNAMLEAADSI